MCFSYKHSSFLGHSGIDEQKSFISLKRRVRYYKTFFGVVINTAMKLAITFANANHFGPSLIFPGKAWIGATP